MQGRLPFISARHYSDPSGRGRRFFGALRAAMTPSEADRAVPALGLTANQIYYVRIFMVLGGLSQAGALYLQLRTTLD